MLRHLGIPARARCGFAKYFEPDRHMDHWVVEYWNAEQQRWIFVDAQLDDLQQGKLHLPFDPLDVPREQFLTGGRAWQLCRCRSGRPAYLRHLRHERPVVRGRGFHPGCGFLE